MRVLVTGGAGFIGSAVCRLLVGVGGFEVINVDKLTYAATPRSLDPIAHELRTGEAPAEIILEYLQAAREYLIDDTNDSQKSKVARDMDIVLNFLKARGTRTIRPDERDNILKRIRRWKAHLTV